MGTAAFVAFRGYDGSHDIVRVARLDPVSGVWSAPIDVSAPGQDVFELDIAADEQGPLPVGGQSGNDHRIQVGRWHQPQAAVFG